jgi:hypothetical protein
MRALLLVLLVPALGCGPAVAGEGEDVSGLIIPRGLYTNPNPYALEPGALVTANNVVMPRPGVVQSRRGFADSGMAPGTSITDMTFYQDKLVFLDSTTLAYWDGASRTNYTGSFFSPTGVHIRWAQANGNLYIPTSGGVYRLSAYNDAAPIPAGGARAFHLALSTTGSSGFLTALRSTAFRVRWNRKDANGNYVPGPVSPWMAVTNSAVATSTSTNTTRAGSTVTVTTSANHGFSTNDVVLRELHGPELSRGLVRGHCHRGHDVHVHADRVGRVLER